MSDRKALDPIPGIVAENTAWPTDVEIDGLKLICTCPACPEQYDVFDAEGTKVGYLRLRHGRFRADVPHCGGKTIYMAHPKGDGIFDDGERQYYLTEAVAAIKKWISTNAVG